MESGTSSMRLQALRIFEHPFGDSMSRDSTRGAYRLVDHILNGYENHHAMIVSVVNIRVPRSTCVDARVRMRALTTQPKEYCPQAAARH